MTSEKQCQASPDISSIADLNRAQFETLMINRGVDSTLAKDIAKGAAFSEKEGGIVISFPTYASEALDSEKREEAGLKVSEFLRNIGIPFDKEAGMHSEITIKSAANFDRAYTISQELVGCSGVTQPPAAQGAHPPRNKENGKAILL